MSNGITFTDWRKSRRSFSNGACVEVGQDDAAIGVRDSMDPDGPILSFGGSTWGLFVRRLRGT